MSNSNFTENNSSQQLAYLPSLSDFLDSSGFAEWLTITTSFILPLISLVGIFCCMLSFVIFLQRSFKDPSFFYYRLLCFVYTLQLIHGVPYGLLFTPRYFPRINTYFSSIYLIYYNCVANVLFHFSEVLYMAILLSRMKIFSLFVRSHFSASPQIISFSFFLTCLLIGSSVPFALKINSLGRYFDSSQNQHVEFYYFSSSEFSSTPFGQLILGFTVFILTLLATLVVGVTLNIVALYKYSSYLRERKLREVANLRATFNNDEAVINKTIRWQALTQKEINERKTEKNMFYMAFTLCSVSVVTRCFIMFAFIYYFFFNSFFTNLISTLINYTIYTLVPTTSIFIFYAFNKLFRKEFNKKIMRKEEPSTSPMNQR